MPSLARNILQMRRSGIRELMELAGAMSEVIHLEVGEPSFNTPPHVVEAACDALRAGYTRYTPNAGFASLRERLVQKMARVNGLQITPDQAVVTVGGMGAFANAMAAIMEPGDEVLLPDPGFPNYDTSVTVNHGVIKRYRCDPGGGFLPDFADLERQIGPRSRVIIVNSPSNPTGAVYPREVMEQLVAVGVKHDLFIISDEVYEEMIFEGEHVSPLLFDRDGRVVGVYSFSKTYAMTGWRLGYLVAAPELAPVMAKLQEPYVSCAAAVSQKAAEAALAGPQDCVAMMRDAYRQRRDLAARLLTELDLPFSYPHGAFYLMVNVARRGLDTYTFCKTFLKEKHVAVAPGETFGPTTREYIRICLAASEADLSEGIRRLAAFVAEG